MRIISLAALLGAVIGPHFLATLLSLAPVLVIIALFFKLRNPVFLTIFLALFFQWLQINIKIIYGNVINLPLELQFSFYQNTQFLYKANMLSNVGLIFFAIGLYLPLRKRLQNFDILEQLDINYKPEKILKNYIIFSIAISVLLLFRNSLGGINTIVVAFSKLKWGFLLVTIIYCNVYNQKKKLLYLVIGFEILLGFTGFFSGFKDIIIILVIALLSIQVELNSKAINKFSVIFIFILSFGLVWTTIKMDFREYLTGGKDSQRVVVSKIDAVNKMVGLLSDLSLENMGLATDALLDRVSYIEFFSIVLGNVPNYMPHENGAIIKESTLFYFKPRIFFPDKGVIDDSDHTNKYTKLNLVGDGQASHSVGFMTDAYIDYGPYGMMILLLMLGCVLGWSMNFLIIKSSNIFWAMIFIIPFYFLLGVYSFNMIKVVGNFVTYIIPVFFVRKIVFKVFNKHFI